ncbi:MAG: hypothetical protein R3C32_02130 [Chloroflexota bacterium]
MRSRHPWTMLLDTFGDPEMAGIFSEAATVRAWCVVERELAVTRRRRWASSRPRAPRRSRSGSTLDIPEGARRGFRHVGYPIVRLLDLVGRDVTAWGRRLAPLGATTRTSWTPARRSSCATR